MRKVYYFDLCFVLQTTKAVYNRILDLKIATAQIIINFGLFLEEHNYFEEAFKAYERGVALFKWPHVYDIWNTYLTKFIKRYVSFVSWWFFSSGLCTQINYCFPGWEEAGAC